MAIVILLGVTVAALVSLNVEIMAEYRIVNRLGLVFEGLGSQATVAGSAVCSGSKSGFTIVAGTAGLAFFHFSHADATADRSTFVTALAAESLAIDM